MLKLRERTGYQIRIELPIDPSEQKLGARKIEELPVSVIILNRNPPTDLRVILLGH